MQPSKKRIARWRELGAGILLVLLLTLFFHYASPPAREGATDLVQLRARSLLGQVPPGEGTPTFPGWATWAGLGLAAVLKLGHFVSAPGEPLGTFLSRTESAQAEMLRVLAALGAALVLVVAGGLLPRILASVPRPATPEAGGMEDEEPPRAVPFRYGVLALILTLALAPALSLGVAQASPSLLGSLLWLALSWRLLLPLRSGDLRWGLVTGLWLGALLGACGWLWGSVPIFLLAALLQGRGVGSVLAALVTGLGVGIALDPIRLLRPAEVGSRLFTEWARAGGWNLAASSPGGESPTGMITLGALVGIGVSAGAIATVAGLSRSRRYDALVWWGGLFLLAAGLPVASGVRNPGLLQQSWAPLWLLFGAISVEGCLDAGWFGRAGRALGPALAGLLLLGAGIARYQGTPERTAVPPEEIVRGIEAIVPREARILAERPLPGLDAVRSAFVLPRDSRRPERFDFAYWPRWYSGFDYVLLSEVQVGQNTGRVQPSHFYGQLRTRGEPVGRWGEGGSGWILLRMGEAAGWRSAPTRDELAALGAAPELLQFLDQLGSFYASTGARDLARTLFQAGIEIEPLRDSFYNNLGSVYLLESEWEEAARVFEQGLRQNSSSAELCYNAGRAFFELGAYGRAESLLRRAVGLRPEFGDAHYELARAFLAQGYVDLARMALERVLELAPDEARRRAVESVLEQLKRGGGEGGEGQAPSDRSEGRARGDGGDRG